MYLAKRRFLLVLIAACLLTVGFVLTADQANAEYRINPYWYRIIGGRPNYDVIVVNRIREKESPVYSSFLSIPVIYGVNDRDLYEQLNRMFYEGIIHFDHEIESNTHKYLERMAVPPGQIPKYRTEVDYQVNYNSGGILSLTVSFSHYLEKHQQSRFMETVNIDLTTGRIIEFADLFTTEQERGVLLRAINQQIKANPSAYFVSEISAQDLSNIQSFYITENHIIVYFDLNVIGPYTTGIPEFGLELSTAVNEIRQYYEGQ